MTSSERPGNTWMLALSEAATEVATVALGLEGCEPLPRVGALPSGTIGAYLPLFSASAAFQIGVIADAEGCQRLARALLGMGDEEADLEMSEVRDAMCEIANLIAGGIKRRVAAEGSLELGLPLFVDGVVIPSEHVDVLAAELELGNVRMIAVLFRDARAGASRAASDITQPARSRRG